MRDGERIRDTGHLREFIVSAEQDASATFAYR
jgi:hypothetical protein